VKLYLLVEGEQTEKKLYRAWLNHCFPQLAEVAQPADLATNSFFMLAGMGYPSYLDRIPRALEDAARYGADHLFICIDSEELSYEERRQEVQGVLDTAVSRLQGTGLHHQGQRHIIVATCCIESWLLGHKKLVPRNPPSQELAAFKSFYDVSVADPERMGRPEGYLTRASFHLEYLREVFRHHDKAYSKLNPGIAKEPHYLAAMRDRSLDASKAPQHLASFRLLWDTWCALGARPNVEQPPAAPTT
jgi:hypothetical protein